MTGDVRRGEKSRCSRSSAGSSFVLRAEEVMSDHSQVSLNAPKARLAPEWECVISAGRVLVNGGHRAVGWRCIHVHGVAPGPRVTLLHSHCLRPGLGLWPASQSHCNAKSFSY